VRAHPAARIGGQAPTQERQRNRRPRGTGNVFVRNDTWYGQWYLRGERVKRSLGPIRRPGSRHGLSKTQAEAKLRELMAETAKAPPALVEEMSIEQAGASLIKQLVVKGRKLSTTDNYESYLRVHLAPFFGDTPIARITAADVEDFLEHCVEAGIAVKSALNYFGFLHGIFEFAARKGWAQHNPCKEVERPDLADEDQGIRFLDQDELDALLRATGAGRSKHTPKTVERAARVRVMRDIEKRSWNQIATAVGVAESTAIYLYRCDPEAVLEDDLARVERVLYLTAAMSGLRQGELLALRWMDIDWTAQRIRVRRNYVRGKFGTPKSKRSSRSVPLADEVAADLERLFQASAYQADEDLVFGHPHTGRPMSRSQLLKRFKRALERAGVRPLRFHDLRHTFGTRMAAAGVPMRTLQEWMGHRDYKTTLIYADYAPARNEVEFVNTAFKRVGTKVGTKLSNKERQSEAENPDEMGVHG
jgi:integrase